MPDSTTRQMSAKGPPLPSEFDDDDDESRPRCCCHWRARRRRRKRRRKRKKKKKKNTLMCFCCCCCSCWGWFYWFYWFGPPRQRVAADCLCEERFFAAAVASNSLIFRFPPRCPFSSGFVSSRRLDDIATLTLLCRHPPSRPMPQVVELHRIRILQQQREQDATTTLPETSGRALSTAASAAAVDMASTDDAGEIFTLRAEIEDLRRENENSKRRRQPARPKNSVSSTQIPGAISTSTRRMVSRRTKHVATSRAR